MAGKKNIFLIILAINTLFVLNPVYGFDILQTNIGAEGVGLGGAMAATVQDPSAIFWNPAGLANINGKDRQKNKTSPSSETDQKFSDDSFDKLFENKPLDNSEENKPASKKAEPFEMQLYTTYGYLTMNRNIFMAATALTLFKGTFGVGLLGTYAPGMDGLNSLAVSTSTAAYGAYVINAGYAWESSIVKMGFSLSGYQQTLATQKYYGGGLNMGVQMTPIPILHIGAAVQNLPGFLQYSSTNPSAFNRLPTILKITLGISTPPPDASLMLLAGLEADLDQSMKAQVLANLGIQVKFAKYFFVMTGIRDNSFALGLGFNVPFLRIAYAINQDKLHTGYQHFVELNFTF